MRTIIILIFLVTSNVLVGQSVPKLLVLADELYQSGQYLEATEFYEKISGLDKTNVFAKYRLGYCYKLTLQHEKASSIFQKLGSLPDQEYQAKALYEYASMLKLKGDFAYADSIFTDVISIKGTEPELINLARKQREGCLLAMREKTLNRGFQVNIHSEVNSPFHDFAAVINPINKQKNYRTTYCRDT